MKKSKKSCGIRGSGEIPAGFRQLKSTCFHLVCVRFLLGIVYRVVICSYLACMLSCRQFYVNLAGQWPDVCIYCLYICFQWYYCLHVIIYSRQTLLGVCKDTMLCWLPCLLLGCRV